MWGVSAEAAAGVWALHCDGGEHLEEEEREKKRTIWEHALAVGAQQGVLVVQDVPAG